MRLLQNLAALSWAGRPCHEGCGTGILPVFASWAGRPCHEGFCKSLTSQAKRFCGGKRYSARRRFSSVRTAAERCTKAVPRPALRPYTSSLTLSLHFVVLHFVQTLRRWRNRLGVATKCIRLRVATKSFRAWRGGKAVPRPAYSAALVTALQISKADTFFIGLIGR